MATLWVVPSATSFHLLFLVVCGATACGRSPEPGTVTPGTEEGRLTEVDEFTVATDCEVYSSVVPASIPMVGVASFTTNLPSAERGIIQFGKTTEYTLEAPVDWDAPDHRTLLLGMPANSDVHYRVIAIAQSTACVGEDRVFRTGASPPGAPGNLSLAAGESAALRAPGFRLAAVENFVAIWNEVGETVWAYNFDAVQSLSMSWDAKYMYARDIGVFDAPDGGTIYRVPIEGGTRETLNVTGGHHHDLVAIPTGFAYIAKRAEGAFDEIFIADPDGANSKPLVNLEPYFSAFESISPSPTKSYVNAINYHDHPSRPFFTVSDRSRIVVIKVDAVTGELMGSIGAEVNSTFASHHVVAEGGGSTWRVQHGHEWYADDKFVVFSNGEFTDDGSRVIHYSIQGGQARLDWQFAMASAPVLSSVVRMQGGNFLAFSAQSGELVELDSSGVAIQTMHARMGGYARYRRTLYGSPSHY
jgi:hypothetical protein